MPVSNKNYSEYGMINQTCIEIERPPSKWILLNNKLTYIKVNLHIGGVVLLGTLDGYFCILVLCTNERSRIKGNQ